MQQTLLLHRDSPVQSGPVPGPGSGPVPGPGPDSGSGPESRTGPGLDSGPGYTEVRHTRTIRTRAPEAAAPRNGKTERQRQRVNLPRGAWA